MAETPPLDDLAASRAEKLARIEALGLDPWGSRFDDHQSIATIRANPAAPFDESKTRARAAGRIVLRRIQGKLHFLDIRDHTGQVQVMIGQQQVGELGWQLAQNLDLGDLIGVEGIYGLTRRGEETIRADKLTFLAKSLEPHPDKHAGMQDEEFRLRHRYLDLIHTPETLRRTKQRVTIVQTIRRFLDARGFMEVETPTLHSIAGGAAARPFITHHNTLGIELFLRIALELHLKRLLVGGLERVYELGRVFRNEGISRKHNPEFTMLELYQAYGDYHSMMDITEGMVIACLDAIGSGHTVNYGERTIDFSPPWPRQKYAELFREHVGLAIDADVTAIASQRGLKTAGKHHDVLVHELFEHVVEPALEKSDRPVIVYDYPAALCPLTKRKQGDLTIAERFELYVLGMELANAYTELNDPVTQEQTFRQQLAGLPADESMAKMDQDFIRAMRHGMPPAGGLGVGIDRLVMLLTDTQTIRDVILFPLLRPQASEGETK
ncbi:MAG: lysine--tRNA ligase [Gemmataceae bacterium]